jgi:hypothetical protein
MIRVEAYAGYKADERPLAFYLGESRYEVEEVLDRWYGSRASWFKVRASDGSTYILKLAHKDSTWTLESFSARVSGGHPFATD